MEKERTTKKPDDLEPQRQPQMCGGAGQRDGWRDGPSVGGVQCPPAAGGRAGWVRGCLRQGEVRDAVLGGGQTTQNAARTALSPPCEKRCGKNVLNPQTQTRFACRKLQGRFGKEFATRKAVVGWMLNIWDGDLQALCSPCPGWGGERFLSH